MIYLLNQKSEFNFLFSYYGPFNNHLVDTFDPLDLYDEEQVPQIKNLLQGQFAWQANPFDVYYISFNIEDIDSHVRIFVSSYVMLYISIDSFTLSHFLQKEPQIIQWKNSDIE